MSRACPLSLTSFASSPRGRAFGMSVRSMLDEQSTMSREQECSAVQGSGSLTRCVVQKPLPSVARPALLRHIGPQAFSRKWPGLPRAPPLGELAGASPTERARLLTENHRRCDSIALTKSLPIAAPAALSRRACPLRHCFAMPPLPKGEALAGRKAQKNPLSEMALREGVFPFG